MSGGFPDGDVLVYTIDVLEWHWRSYMPNGDASLISSGGGSGSGTPTGRCCHVFVPRGDDIIVMYGGFDNYALYLTDFWLLNITSRTWRAMPFGVNDAQPGAWLKACTTVWNDVLYLFGGLNYTQVNSLWTLDLTTFKWSHVNDEMSGGGPPLGVVGAAAVRVAHRWFIHGGLDTTNTVLSTTWVLDLDRRAWFEIVTLDSGTASAPPSVFGRAAAYDGIIFFTPANPLYVSQMLVVGVHDVSVSAADGDDVACQLDETRPCATAALVLARWTGASTNALPLSTDLRCSVTLLSSIIVQQAIINKPLLIQAARLPMATITINCGGTRSVLFLFLHTASPSLELFREHAFFFFVWVADVLRWSRSQRMLSSCRMSSSRMVVATPMVEHCGPPHHSCRSRACASRPTMPVHVVVR